jgi:hypothetical protein
VRRFALPCPACHNVLARGVKDRETLVELTARAGEAMFDPSRVAVGRGRDDEEAKTSALTVGMELYAVGRWDGRGRLVACGECDYVKAKEAVCGGGWCSIVNYCFLPTDG